MSNQGAVNASAIFSGLQSTRAQFTGGGMNDIENTSGCITDAADTLILRVNTTVAVSQSTVVSVTSLGDSAPENLLQTLDFKWVACS